MSRPYHPQTNGLCERTNRTRKDRLSHVADQSNWDKTPKEFHLPDELPLDMDLADLQEVLGALAKKREEAVQKANANQDKAHFKQSMAYNKRMNKGAKTFDFQPGQQVYTALETKKGRGKIKRLWQGPERIQSIQDGKFKLENGKTMAKEICKPHFSSSLHSVLPPFHKDPINRKQDHGCSTAPQPPSHHTYAADPAEGVQDTTMDHFDPLLHAPPHVCRKSQHKMVCPGGIDVTPQSLLTLQSPNWLDDSIIQSFLGVLMLHHTKSVALSTFLVEKLPKPEALSPGWLLPQVQMSALDWILLPVHTDDHWLLVVADVTKRQIHTLDSIPQVARRKECFDLWMNFLQRRAEVCPSDLPVRDWEEGNLFSEIQDGFADCGVYLCMNAENMVRCGCPALDINPPAAPCHIFKEVVAHGHLPGEKCDSPICTEPDQKSWVQCRCCTARVHTSCTGQDPVVQSHSETFTCTYCM